MKDIVKNIALFSLTDYCKENQIDCSGSHLEYAGKFRFNLIKDELMQPIACIQFHKQARPSLWGKLQKGR